ncbi:DUF3298 domain-containing protein [Rubrivirga sp. S365]|uniref:DUF3298 domain-containing protein n=1 Tax=Rubrivirga litoralis TaxID=3075598 RepID=A0ABU3BS62_9BACT|nr:MULTISPECIES: DUF3298 domain-containing protein [unclassified Rubrivirga]MDT0632119.1 DUF3298 domain-containing protein [Rubrivirga sp. F394]MDT7856197.1 DUF3298 domain-containing protein [Rubrivirga sp. S365]
MPQPPPRPRAAALFRPALALLAASVWAGALAACGADPSGPVVRHRPSLSVRADSVLRGEPALRYTVRIGYPQLTGAAGEPVPPTVRAVNAAVRDSVEALADAFRPDSAPPPGEVSPAYVVDVTGGYDRVLVTDDLFSALVDVYAFTGGAHGNTFFQPLTFDLTTGRPVLFADLFASNAPAGDTLAAYVERAVVTRLARGLETTVDSVRAHNGFFSEGLGPIREGRLAFTLGADSLRVHVPPYQLAPHVAGAFDVGVPYGALVPFAPPGGAVRRLAER